MQDLYKNAVTDFKKKGGSGLNKCVSNMMGQQLCKAMQMSNWERRPLSLSQLHYASMDAWILLQMRKKLIEKLPGGRQRDLIIKRAMHFIHGLDDKLRSNKKLNQLHDNNQMSISTFGKKKKDDADY